MSGSRSHPSSAFPADSARQGQRDPAVSSRAVYFAAATIITVGLIAYWNSFAGVFVFDDLPAIRDNITIRDWTAWRQIFFPPSFLTTSGRPIVNASFALSYSLSGTGTWGYHLINLAVHLGAGLTLFGIVRRSLLLPPFRARFGRHALPLAGMVATLWLVHPLQTESVTYLVQRAESLMGLFFLLTFYCFIRGLTATSASAKRWHTAAVGFCALGMGSKEVMVSAPLLVLLYDRTFVAGSFSAAWAQRKKFYVGLAATWILLGALVLHEGGNRGGSIGFGVAIGWWQHGLTQFAAITRYLLLSAWPSPLTFEYEPEWVAGWRDLLLQAPFVIGLLAATWLGLRRNGALGFFGAWFFSILAPTSVMPAPTQLIAEHRMYLPLAPLVVLTVVGVYRWLGPRGVYALGLLVLVFVFLTVRRNADYRSEIALWTDTVAKRPKNPLAHGSLGNALSRAGRIDEALLKLSEAVRLAPTNALLQFSRGLVLARLGRIDDAMAAYVEAIRLRPIYFEAHNNYAVALIQKGRRAEALTEFSKALALDPTDAGVHYNLGALLLEQTRTPDAIGHFETAVRLRPDYPEALVAWGTALAFQGRVEEALTKYRQAIALRPDDVSAHHRAGQLLLAVDRIPEAISYFETALKLSPDNVAIRANLEDARRQLKKE